MPTRCRLVIGVVSLGIFLAAAPAWATMDNLKSLKQVYSGKDAKAYGCKTCHTGLIGKKGELNAYGKALEALKEKGSDTKKLKPEDFKAVEFEDSDKDGASNGDELKGGTNPGDTKSVPKPLSKADTMGSEKQPLPISVEKGGGEK